MQLINYPNMQLLFHSTIQQPKKPNYLIILLSNYPTNYPIFLTLKYATIKTD